MMLYPYSQGQERRAAFTSQDAWVLASAVAIGVVSSLIASILYNRYVRKKERTCRIPMKKSCPRK